MVLDAQEGLSMSTLKERCRLAQSVRTLLKTQSVLVGCSGGGFHGWAAVIARHSHATRGFSLTSTTIQNKTKEQWGVVQRFADSCGLQAVKLVVDPIGVRKGGGLEDGARRERFRLLTELKQEMGIDVIALAHHNDDQVETFFIRLTHGSRIYGLRGIDEARSDIVRPLLSFSKSELSEYAKRCRIEFVEDPTNRELGSLRNRIRHTALPALDGVFGIGWRSKLTQMMQALRLRSTLEFEMQFFSATRACKFVVIHLQRRSVSKARADSAVQCGDTTFGWLITQWSCQDSQADQFVEICAHYASNSDLRLRGRMDDLRGPPGFRGSDFRKCRPPTNLSPGVNKWNEWEISLGAPLEGGVVIRLFIDADSSQLIARFPNAGERFHNGERVRKVSELFSDNRVPWRLRKRSLVLGSRSDAAFIWGIGANERRNSISSSEALLVWIKPPSDFG